MWIFCMEAEIARIWGRMVSAAGVKIIPLRERMSRVQPSSSSNF